MPRPPRADETGGIYHALNRGNSRADIFHKEADFDAFERIMAEGLDRYQIKLFSYQLMNNHWHLVLSPEMDGEMSRFMRWISATHTMRYHAHYRSSGEGHVYQGRFKSFPIQDDTHFLTVCRYVERNALQAEMVRRAEDWRWGSLYRWLQNTEPDPKLLAPWPINRSPNWVARVNQSLTKNEIEAIQHSIKRSKPYGDEAWIESTAKRLDLESTLRPRGRPRIECEENKNNES